MFFDRLQSLCESKSLKISKVASDILGVSSSAATGWKNGAVPNSSVVIKAAEFFDVSTDYLLGLDDVPSRRRKDAFTQENTVLLRELQTADPYTRQIVTALLHAVLTVANAKKEPATRNPHGSTPVSGFAAAGSPLHEESGDEEMISVPTKYLARDLDQNRYFVARAQGDSMEPTIPDGSHVVVERNVKPAQGSLALIGLDGPGGNREYAIRIVRFHADKIELISYNDAYPPISYPLSAVRSIERIVHVIPAK